MQVTPPRSANWFDLFPEPYCNDQKVVVIMAPMAEGWKTAIMESRDGKYNFGVLVSPKGMIRGMQVIDTALDSYLDHKQVLSKYGLEMVDPAFIGLMSEIPQRLLLDEDRAPLVFPLAAMWRSYLDLKRVFKRSDLKC